MDYNQFQYTTGGQVDVSHIELIDVGGYGEVHKMQFKAPDAPEECFARKLIRTIIATKASIECEVQTITQILGTGGHENIVRILRHGMLPTSDYYFIDMELCSLNLRDYLGKYDRSIILRHFRVKQLHPVFIEKEETESAEITISQWQNIWTIMGHIASGLHFLHEHGFAHRDVKPANVLYNNSDNKWKMSDFGITSSATSDVAFPTVNSRGTMGYRAPEFLLELPTYTKKVDIWAIGCILGEIAGIPRFFETDFAVQQWYTQGQGLTFPASFDRSIMGYNHLMEMIRLAMHREPSQRPPARELQQLFSAYNSILECHGGQQFFRGRFFPSLKDWKNAIVDECNDSRDVLSRLAEWCEMRDRYPSLLPLLEALQELSPANLNYYRRLNGALLHTDCSTAIKTWKRLVERFPCKSKFRNNLTAACLAKGGLPVACMTWEELVHTYPNSKPFLIEYAKLTAEYRLEQKLWVEAADILVFLIHEEPQNERYQFQLRKTCLVRGDLDKEIAVWSALVDAHPRSEGLVCNLREATDKIADAKDKIMVWMTLVGKHPEEETLVSELKFICEELGDERETVNVWVDLFKRTRDVGSILAHLREALEALGDPDEIILAWTALASEYPQLEGELIRAREAKERSLRTQEALRAILRLDG